MKSCIVSLLAAFGAFGAPSVTAESCTTPGTVLKEINFNKDKHGNDIVASCSFRAFKGECSGDDSSCDLPLYPNYNYDRDCINSYAENAALKGLGVTGGVCGCGDVVCGCLGFTPPGLAGGPNFPEFPYGMSVTARKKNSNGIYDWNAETAMLFDSTEDRYTGGDYDLQVKGADWGNLMIISEDGDINDPDDNAHGGYMEFTFDNPVEVVAMDYVDIEGHETSTLKAFGDNNAELTPGGGVFVPAVSDGGRNTLPFAYQGVRKVKLDLGGSGAVAAFRICVPAGSSFGGKTHRNVIQMAHAASSCLILYCLSRPP